MKRAVMNGPGDIVINEIAVPEPNDNEVLVKIKAVGICTWEQGYYSGKSSGYPFVGGHEICGIVEKVGKSVFQELVPGDKVVVASLTRCGECYFCRRGLDNLCENALEGSVPGEAWGPGGFAEYFVAKGYEIYKIAEDVPFVHGTLAEPIACVTRSVDRVNIRPGDTVVVLGGGVMGILHLLLAQMRGARVILSEPDEKRREKALGLGAAAAFDPLNVDLKTEIRTLTGGRGAEAVFFTAGGTKAFEEGVGLLVKNGFLVVYGAIKPSSDAAIDPMTLHYEEIFLTGVIKHSKENFRRAAEIISSGNLPLGELVSETFPFEEIVEGFKRGSASDTYRVVLEL